MILAVMAPSIAFAQSTTVTTGTEALLRQLITLLLQRIEQLQEQMAEQEAEEHVEEVDIEINLGVITKTSTTAQISWTTNVSASSKVTITKVPVKSNSSTSQHLPSANGISNQGLVSIVGLEQNTEYHYLIEATADGSMAEKEGTFTTEKSAEQIAKEEEEEYWRSLPLCPVRDGFCKTSDTSVGWGCMYDNGIRTGCGG